MLFPKKIRLPHEAYENREAIFHVVVSTLPGEKPFQNAALGSEVWQVVTGEQDRAAVRISAACLIPDHLHLIVSPRDKTLIRWMNDFKSFTTHISKQHRPQRFLWHRSFYDRRLRDAAEFEAAVHYVLQNPAAAALVEEGKRWPWVDSWLA